MNVSEALNKTNEYLKEVDNLRRLQHGSRNYHLWQDNVRYVLEAAFGKGSYEYVKFKDAGYRGVLYMNPTEQLLQKEYQEDLTNQETALMSIINKYNIIGMTSSNYPASMAGDPPKAFIAHGGESQALSKLKDFLRALGVEPLIVEEQPSKGREKEQNVDTYFEQAHCEIVLATAGDIQDQKTGATHPRLNVIDELGRGRQRFPDKVILLLEKGVELPTNVSGIVHERFTQDNMEDAFIKVARELTAFGVLKAAKPAKKRADV